MKVALLFAAVVIIQTFCHSIVAQHDRVHDSYVGPELLNTPAIFIPDHAVLSGLGGLIRVRVSIDDSGNVASVEKVTGPGWTCSQVTRRDVVAMREAATQTATLAKFSPATHDGVVRPSSITLNFDFPGEESTESKIISFGTTDRSSNSPPDQKNASVKRGTIASSPKVDSLSGEFPGPRVRVKQNDKLFARNSVVRPPVISGGVVNGKALNLPRPVYPAGAVAVGVSGVVQVLVLVEESGSIFSARAVSGHPFLRAASVAAACEATFSPVYVSGQPVRVSGVITYNYVHSESKRLRVD